MASINQSCNTLPNGVGVPLQKIIEALRADLAASRAEVVKLVTDITATRAEVAKLVTDMASRITNHNTLIAKLNADAGVTDADYAAASAATAAAPAAVSAAAPAAMTVTA